LVVGRADLEVPLYRLPGSQALVGVPVADATQWDQSERVADFAYPVCEQLQTGEVISQDDTHVQRVSRIAENRQAQAEEPPAERTGMSTTGLVGQQEEHTLCLSLAGRAHARENLGARVGLREAGRDTPVVLSEALVRNAAEDAARLRGHGLAPGRRTFSELEDAGPEECPRGLDALTQGCDQDEAARLRQLPPTDRLAYHHPTRGPILEALTH